MVNPIVEFSCFANRVGFDFAPFQALMEAKHFLYRTCSFLCIPFIDPQGKEAICKAQMARNGKDMQRRKGNSRTCMCPTNRLRSTAGVEFMDKMLLQLEHCEDPSTAYLWPVECSLGVAEFMLL